MAAAFEQRWHADGHQLHHRRQLRAVASRTTSRRSPTAPSPATAALSAWHRQRVTDSTITNNHVGGARRHRQGTATLDNTIVALNTIGGSGATPSTSPATVSSSSAYNLIGTGGTGGLTNGVNGNQVGVANPGLGPLADNGGPTQTIALAGRQPRHRRRQQRPGRRSHHGPTPDHRSARRRLPPDRQRHGRHRRLRVPARGQRRGRRRLGDPDRRAPDRRRRTATAAGRPEHRPALAGHRPVADHPQPGRDADRRRRHGHQRHRRQLRAGDRLRLGDELHHHPGPADRRGRPGHDHHRQPGHLTFSRRLDVLPGDFNDDGVVNSQDLVGVRNEWLASTVRGRRSSATSTATAWSTSTTTTRCGTIGTTLPSLT